jgi:hypothetical protein
MNPKTQRNRKIGIVFLVAVFLLGVVVILTALPGKDNPEENEPSPTNAQTNQGQTGVAYEGFVALSEYGFTSTQMAGIKYALYKYKPKATSFVIDKASIVDGAYDSDNPTPSVQMTFNLKIDNGSPFKVTLDKYTDLTTVRLRLANAGGTQVYDSGEINTEALDSSPTYLGD